MRNRKSNKLLENSDTSTFKRYPDILPTEEDVSYTTKNDPSNVPVTLGVPVKKPLGITFLKKVRQYRSFQAS